MTAEERSSIENGIWLCQKCAKLIDNDETRFTAGVIEEWKRIAEATALLEIQSSHGGSSETSSDAELLRFFTQCFDRPAFQDPFHVEGSMEAFDRAIEDTITAINTGCLRDRNGDVVAQAKGKAFIERHEWRRELDAIVDLLRAIRSRYKHAQATGAIHVHALDKGQEFYAINDRVVAQWMDSTRSQVIELFSRLCEQAGIPGLHFPRGPWGHPW
jgi:hypothetical protein